MTRLSAKPQVKASDLPGLLGPGQATNSSGQHGRQIRHPAVPVRSRPKDVITIEELMETLAAIVVVVVVVPLVLLGIILVEVLTGFILSFL